MSDRTELMNLNPVVVLPEPLHVEGTAKALPLGSGEVREKAKDRASELKYLDSRGGIQNLL